MLKFARAGQVLRRRAVGELASKAVRGLSFNTRDQAFHLLGLKTFSDAEIQRSYGQEAIPCVGCELLFGGFLSADSFQPVPMFPSLLVPRFT
jgi:hypothetical protein